MWHQPRAPPALPAPPRTAERLDLLPMLADCPHLLVVGHTGGGKTTLLHALARHLSHTATVLVCDPDAIGGAQANEPWQRRNTAMSAYSW